MGGPELFNFVFGNRENSLAADLVCLYPSSDGILKSQRGLPGLHPEDWELLLFFP